MEVEFVTPQKTPLTIICTHCPKLRTHRPISSNLQSINELVPQGAFFSNHHYSAVFVSGLIHNLFDAVQYVKESAFGLSLCPIKLPVGCLCGSHTVAKNPNIIVFVVGHEALV